MERVAIVLGAVLAASECEAACTVRVASELDLESTPHDVANAEPVVIRSVSGTVRLAAIRQELYTSEASDEPASEGAPRQTRCYGAQQDNGTRQLLEGVDLGPPRYCRGKMSLPSVCEDDTLQDIASVAL